MNLTDDEKRMLAGQRGEPGSPRGTEECSPGREPWGCDATCVSQPRRGGRAAFCCPNLPPLRGCGRGTAHVPRACARGYIQAPRWGWRTQGSLMNLTDDEERMFDGEHGRPAGCPRQARCSRRPPDGTAVSAVFFA